MPRASKASSRRSVARRRVSLSPTVRISLDDGDIVAPAYVIQSLETRWYGLGNAEGLFYEPILHRFDVVVSRELLDLERSFVGQNVSDEEWDRLKAALRPLAAPNHRLAHRDRDDELWLAYLLVGELPTHIIDSHGGWSEVCDSLGDSLRDAWEVVDRLKARGDGCTTELCEGALLWPQRLGVHPRARGQSLGLQLLAHALWALHRSFSDVAILEAGAVQSAFDAAEPGQTPESYRRLCAYYSRLGFRRCYPRIDVSQRAGSIMMLRLGTQGIRARRVGGAWL